MDFSDNTVLKEHYTFFVGDANGQMEDGEHGLYNRDTRMLSRYRWRWSSAGQALRPLLTASPRPDLLQAHHALIDGPSQTVAVRRELRLLPDGMVDDLELENTSMEPRSLALSLEVTGDFIDLFEARGWSPMERTAAVATVEDGGLLIRYTASDGLRQAVRLSFSAVGQGPELQVGGPTTGPTSAGWRLDLEPGERRHLRVETRLLNPSDEPPVGSLSYEAWREGFAALPSAPEPVVLARAIDDLRGLLLFTQEGPVPAAGIPWFVAAFGRDALLTAHLLLPLRPEVAEATLRYLARYQGSERDAFRAEQPGKIMHELRFGELTRSGRSPHGPYYGTVDATPLFLMLLDAHRQATGGLDLVQELRPAWEAALRWLVEDGDADGDGFVEFSPAAPGAGLTVQSWKDSHDSMSHADGRLAEGALAVSEVQGYSYAAYRAAAGWYQELGEQAAAATWSARAEVLAERFHHAYWLEELGTYAMALDGDKRPLAVHNSDAGQLLWTGIVPVSHAPRLVATLFSPAMWSGWGLRTLGSGEVRYNPLSYHNGSVWPHDTALFAGGLLRYGFHSEAARVREALYAVAAAQPDLRLPELIGGYPRDDRPPVPYPVACRPQAWDAAALVYLLGLL